MKLDSNHFKIGLSSKEVDKLLKQSGPNQLATKKSYSALKILVSQFASPLVYVLLFAGLVTIYLHEWLDTLVILIVVLINAFLGFYQEQKAAKALDALKNFLQPKAKVIRNGQVRNISLSKIVPGDICIISAGQNVPGDGILVSATDLKISEAILTGESKAVSKQAEKDLISLKFQELSVVNPEAKSAENWAYMGTMVKAGIGHLLIVKTGRQTKIGKISLTLSTLKEKPTPLQRKLAKLSKSLSLVVVLSTLVVFIFGWWRGEELVVMLETAVAIAVSAIPESLVVSLTVVLALGMQRIFKRKSLVRKLLAAETLGSVSVICCDKTGTLTEGRLTVASSIGQKKELIKAAILANDQVDEVGQALSEWAKEELSQGYHWTTANNLKDFKDQYQRLSSIPFSSQRKYMATLIEKSGKKKIYVIGAPELIISKTNLSQSQQEIELSHLKDLGKEGYRVVAIATKQVSGSKEVNLNTVKNLDWQGMIYFEDKIRSGVKAALKTAQAAGVDVKVITGDYAQTAAFVLEKLQLQKDPLAPSQIMTGDKLSEYSHEELKKKIREVVLFARTNPEQKLKIVKVLQDMGEIVAMTGDGVNDAPALKAAEIGVVVNEASDVSKETADMVLLDSNFSSIVSSIKEGRIIMENMKKIVTYLLTDVFSELVLIGGSLLMGWPLPLTAVQILWINLVEDSLPGLSLAFEKSDDDVMKDSPKGKESSIFDKEMKTLIMIVGLVDLLLLAFYGWLRSTGMPLMEVRTIIFVLMATDSLLYLFSVKSLRKNIWQINLWENKFLLGSVLLSFFLIVASVYWSPLQSLLNTTTLSAKVMLGLFALGFIQLGLVEGVKWLFIRQRSKT